MDDKKNKSKKYKINKNKIKTRKKSNQDKYKKFIKKPIKFSDLIEL